MKQFKEGIALTVNGVTESKNDFKRLPSGKIVSSTRVRINTQYGMARYELVGWDKDAERMEEFIHEGGLRVVAIGIPVNEVYNNRVQQKLSVMALWVENIGGKRFDPVIVKDGVEAEARVFEPIEMPEGVRLMPAVESLVDADKGRGAVRRAVENESPKS